MGRIINSFFSKFRLQTSCLFDQKKQEKDIAGKSIKGGMIVAGSTVFMFGINMARTMVLARLLTPDDFGIIGMVAVFVNLATIFKSAGLSMATVQKDRISHDQISTLFWINVIICIIIGIILLGSAPLIVRFYDKPELLGVTAALAVPFALEGLKIQHAALLKRYMRFDLLAIKTIFASIIGVGVSILFALQGWMYWALILGTIATAIAEVFLIYFFCPWMPGKMQRKTGVRSMLNFGIHLTASSFVNYFARNTDNMLVGRSIGAEGLGYYQKAYQLFRLPINNILSPIREVAFPALSTYQNQPDKFVGFYKKMLRIIATVTFPFAVYFFIEADFIIHLVLGDQWTQVIPVFKFLAIGGLIQPITHQAGIVMISLGNSKRYLIWQILYSGTLIISFVLGIPYGIEGLAVAYAIAEFTIFIPGLFYCYRGTPVKPSMVLNELYAPLLTVFFAAGTVILAKTHFPDTSIIYRIGFALVFFCVYLLASWSRKNIRDVVYLFWDQIKKKKKPK